MTAARIGCPIEPIGGAAQAQRIGRCERLGGLEVDDQLDLHRLLEGSAASIPSLLTPRLSPNQSCKVGHQVPPREHQGMGLDVASAGGRGWRPDCGPRQVLAARQLGIVKIPVVVAAGWTEAQKRAYVLADNQLAITGSGWDPELLRLELGELKRAAAQILTYGMGGADAARKSPNTSPVSARARARARVEAGNQRPWPADKVERWAIDRLIPYAKNARTHTDAQVAAIAASIKDRRDRREHQGMGLDVASAGGRGRRAMAGPTIWLRPRLGRERLCWSRREQFADQIGVAGAGRRQRWWARMAA